MQPSWLISHGCSIAVLEELSLNASIELFVNIAKTKNYGLIPPYF